MSSTRDLFTDDPRFQPELADFQDNNSLFCVIKDFRKRGSAVFGWNAHEDGDSQANAMRCRLLAKSPIQVVTLGGPDCLYMYSESAPYTILRDSMEGVQMCVTGNVPGEFIKPVHYEAENTCKMP